MDRIAWCFEHGMELVEPNRQLFDGYMLKAMSALKACEEVTAIEWKIDAAYYAMYHSLYAILMLIGVKSEIHDCTIAFMKEFLDYSQEDASLIETAKELRIDMQYYVDRIASENLKKKVLDNASGFVTRSRALATRVSVSALRSTLQKILGPR